MSEQENASPTNPPRSWRDRWYEIIFEADTPAGKLFDVVLLVAILLSVLVVICESVEEIREAYPGLLDRAEWFFTLLFTAEYAMRIVCARRSMRYIFSFYGVVDLLAILPTYLIALPILEGGPQTQRLAVIRALRLLRAFRIFKLAHMLYEAHALRQAIWAARAKVTVFLSVVLIAVVIVGSAMHLIEGGKVVTAEKMIEDEKIVAVGDTIEGGKVVAVEETIEGGKIAVVEMQVKNGFNSIPQSMYWAIVTMTTVGYGDVSPHTPLGKGLAACMMILGYCMIIVPTGIVSAELAHAVVREVTTQVCPECMAEGHDADASHCKYCGAKL